MDPRSLRLTNRLNNEEEQILNLDSRVIADRQNIRRLDNEMARQEQYTERQELINNNTNRNHHINIAIFVLLGVLIIIVAVIAGLAFERANNGSFPENSISAEELDNNDSYTVERLNLTSESTGALTIETGGIAFGNSQITADEFRVIDGAIAGTVVPNKAVVVDSNRNVHGFGYITVGGASFTDGTCFKSLITAESGISVMGGSSFGSLTKFHNGICVLGGVSFADTVDFYDGMSVGGTLYSYGGMSVTGTTNFSNLVTVESNTGLSVEGGISMSGTINMYSELNSTDGISVIGGLSVSGYTQLWGNTRIEKYNSVSTDGLCGITGQYVLTKKESGNTFYIDYVNKNYHHFVLPELESTDSGYNYRFVWAEGMSSGDRQGFSLITGGRDEVMSGHVFQREKTTNNSYVIDSNSVDITTDDYRLDLGSMILDGSVIDVESYKGRWLVNGTIGISSTPTAVDIFQNHNYKKWVMSGTCTAEAEFREANLNFSDNGINWHYSYHIPNDVLIAGPEISALAFGDLSNGTSIYVGTLTWFSGSKNIIYSNTGTSWQYTSMGTCFLNSGNFETQGKGIAFGKNNLGEDMFVAVGQGNTSVNNILWSSGSTAGTSFNNSDSNGEIFERGTDVAYGVCSNGTCVWVAAGQDSTASKRLLWSIDGMCWARSTGSTFDTYASTVAFGTDNVGNPLWVAGGADNSGEGYERLKYSTDGMCWVNSSVTGTAPTNTVNTVAYGISTDGTCLWLAGIEQDSNKSIFYSKDGMSWSPIEDNNNNIASNSVRSIAFGLSTNGTSITIVAGLTQQTDSIVGSNDNLLYSIDGGQNFITSGNGIAETSIQSIVFSRPLYPNRNNLVDDIYT